MALTAQTGRSDLSLMMAGVLFTLGSTLCLAIPILTWCGKKTQKNLKTKN
jgi:hypothetical protein